MKTSARRGYHLGLARPVRSDRLVRIEHVIEKRLRTGQQYVLGHLAHPSLLSCVSCSCGLTLFFVDAKALAACKRNAALEQTPPTLNYSRCLQNQMQNA